MPLSTRDPFDDNCAHLATFPDHILRDIATNECAQHDYRKHAVEVLLVRKSPLVQHPDLRIFVDELEVELDGIEFDHPAPEDAPGPLTASVTTETMFSDPPPVPEEVFETLEEIKELTEDITGADPIVPTESSSPVPTRAPRKSRKPKDTTPNES